MSSMKTRKQFLSAQEQPSSGALGNGLSGAAPPHGGRTVWFHRTEEEFARNKELIANLLPRPPPQRRWYCVAASKVKCFLSQVMAAWALPGSLHPAAFIHARQEQFQTQLGAGQRWWAEQAFQQTLPKHYRAAGLREPPVGFLPHVRCARLQNGGP